MLGFSDDGDDGDSVDFPLCSFVSFVVKVFFPFPRYHGGVGGPARFDLYLLVSQTGGGAADKPPSIRI
jgi:hypothetical protein